MGVKEDYLDFKEVCRLSTRRFEDRVKLQLFLKERIDDLWREVRSFSNGGLVKNYMTRYAIGFAYYDCRPSQFCRNLCYGLPISGLHDFYMFRLAVITSESLKDNDQRFIRELNAKISTLKHLRIGHWGDATTEQIPQLAQIINKNHRTKFWWYTRKIEVATMANELELPNLRAYLSLDPSTYYPDYNEYPFPFTYFLGNGQKHPKHNEIIHDERLVAIFPLIKGRSVEDASKSGLKNHPKICREKEYRAIQGRHGDEICLACNGRCRY